MMRAALTVARYAMTEAMRSGLPWLAGLCLLAATGFATFLSGVAIAESEALRVSVAAALLRACLAFLLAAHVVTSVAREANDKGLELALSLPISRPAWYLGKLLGFAATGAVLAVLFSLPLAAWARPGDLAAWALALSAEAALIAAAALFFASAITQSVAAIAAVAGFYALARAMASIQAIAAGPLAADTAAGGIARWVVDALALLLPRLDAVAPGDWLAYGAPEPMQLAGIVAGLCLYIVLLAAAGLFDFSRRNL